MTEKINIFELTRNLLIKSLLPEQVFAERTVSSTNDLAKDEAFDLSHRNVSPKIYLADQQTKGRGRGQNSWLNPPPGDALMVTWSWAMASTPQAITGPLFGLAVYRALTETFSSSEFSLKPPNDIYVGDKKILGLLAEAMQQGANHRLILGLGLNVASSPIDVLTAGYLGKTARIDRHNWALFFQNLSRRLENAMHDCQRPEISFEDRGELLVAINKHVLNRDHYIKIHGNGDLETTRNELVSWRSL